MFHSSTKREEAKEKYKEQFGKLAKPRYYQLLTEFEWDEPTDDHYDIEAMVIDMEVLSTTD